MSIGALGWLGPGPQDARDREFLLTTAPLPPKVDLRKKFYPPVLNQGTLGSCTACMAVQMHLHEQFRQGIDPTFGPSRLFQYYNTRALMGDQYVKIDSGAYIRTAVKALAKFGACRELDWKYQIAKFKTKPPEALYGEAEKFQALEYLKVTQTLNGIKGALAVGHPVGFGFSVYDSFDFVGKNGKVPFPKRTERMHGGHAVTAVGYDDAKRHFIVLNSWGVSWADGGYCYFPYEYLTNATLAQDFWTVRQIESELLVNE